MQLKKITLFIGQPNVKECIFFCYFR